MGRGYNKQRTQKRDFRNKRADVWEQDDSIKDHNKKIPRQQNDRNDFQNRNKTWVPKNQYNAQFEEYYKEQQLMPDSEFNDFLRVLKEPLPVTFRINGSGRFADSMKQKIEQKLLKPFEDGVLSEDIIERPKNISWYPNQLAWHLSFSRSDLRKQPEFQKIHQFLVKETNYGGITRQEAVSMIPPLLLDVEPHHWVLDMCAAPGSKTFQLLEMIHQKDNFASSGLIIANDADIQRCNLLTHQTKRMYSPNLVITNQDGTQFPLLKNAGDKFFDRILCDVPCSGDGTIRKAPDIWSKWNYMNANNLHSLQIRLALQAFKLLKTGGFMVYSTCSFNPVEDEAVIKEVLKITQGALQLVDTSGKLPTLKRRQGLKRWKVLDSNSYYTSYAEAQANKAHKLEASMFPDVEVDDDKYPLERCIRVLPHQQNTGGFFIALLQKVKDLELAVSQIQKETQQQRNQSHTYPLQSYELSLIQSKQLQEIIQNNQNTKQDIQSLIELQQSTAEQVLSNQDLRTYVQKQLQNLQDAQYFASHKVKQIKEGESSRKQLKSSLRNQDDGLQQTKIDQKDIEIDDLNGQHKQLQLNTKHNFNNQEINNSNENGNCIKASIENGGQSNYISTQIVQTLELKIKNEQNRETQKVGIPDTMSYSNVQNRLSKSRAIDPIIFFEGPIAIEQIIDFFGIKDFVFDKHLIARTGDLRPKKLYYISNTIQQLLMADLKQQIKIQSLGVKIFDRQESRDPSITNYYRICQEGLPIILPHVTKQIVHVSIEDFLRLVQTGGLRFQDRADNTDTSMQILEKGTKKNLDKAVHQQFQKSAKRVDTQSQQQLELNDDFDDDLVIVEVAEKNLSNQQDDLMDAKKLNDSKQEPSDYLVQDEDTLQEIYQSHSGCCIVLLKQHDLLKLGIQQKYNDDGTKQTSKNNLAMVCWRGRVSITVLVSKEECHQLQDMILQLQQFSIQGLEQDQKENFSMDVS